MLHLNGVTMYLVLIFISLAIVFFLYMTRKFSHWKRKGVPYIKPIPVFGNIFDICSWKCTIGDFCRQVYDKTTEPFIGVFVLDEPFLIVNDLDLVKDILVKDFDHFADRTITNNEKSDIIGSNMLFLLKTPAWTSTRRKITPVFSSGKLKLMSRLMEDCAKGMVEYLKNSIEESKVIDVKDLCSMYTVNVITSTAFGFETNCFKDKNAIFKSIALRSLNWRRIWHAIQANCFYIAPGLVRLFNMRFLDKTSSDFFTHVFWKSMHEREAHPFLRNDLLDILMEIRKQDQIDGVKFLDDNVSVAQAAQFFIAGYESSSSTITFALTELALNPDIQSKVRQEILSKRKEHGTFSYDCLQDMEYLKKNILETLRKYPILPFLDRKCNTQYKLAGTDVILEPGDKLYIPIMGIHYNEKYFPDPNIFNPDRFDKANCDTRHNMTFLPFGDGPRGCIGRRYALLNTKYALAYVLSNFEVKLCDKTNFELSTRGFLMQPKKELYLKFVKRNNPF